MSLEKNALRAGSAALLLAVAGSAAAEEAATPKDYSGAYLCKITASGGLKFAPETKKWVSTTFNVEDSSYVVKVNDTGEIIDAFLGKSRLHTITVKDFRDGLETPCYHPKALVTEGAEKVPFTRGTASCLYLGYDYAFSFETLKMQVMFWGGYMNEASTDTPYVAVGKCQRID